MSTSDYICYLRNGSLYRIVNGSELPVTFAETLPSAGSCTLIIDDGYLFYVGMEHISVTGKKLKSVAGNYLNLIFPNDMIKSFGVFQSSAVSLIYILSYDLVKAIEENDEFFTRVKKITSPFIELAVRYHDFIYSDGSRFYKKTGAEITPAAVADANHITKENLFEELDVDIKSSITLPGVSRSRFSKTPYIIPGICLGVCYLIFLIGGLVSATSASRVAKYYDNAINQVYKAANVADAGDPYGMLLYKSQAASKVFDGKRVITIINDISETLGDNVTLNTFSIRDKAVRIDGVVADFAKLEELEKYVEDKLKVQISMEDTKKTGNGVSFIMKYEQ